MFGVLRFVIQPFFLLWKRQPIKAEPQNIEQANSKDSGDPCHLLVTKLGHPVNGEVEPGSALSGSQIWFPVRLSI